VRFCCGKGLRFKRLMPLLVTTCAVAAIALRKRYLRGNTPEDDFKFEAQNTA
jgi:peptidoglycan/LPS O-acetylase OafA/YrhL